MNTLEIGQKLVELCKNGKNFEAIDSLYSPDIVSVEATTNDKMPKEVHGFEAIKNKNQWWNEHMQVNSAEVKGPFPLDDRFAVYYKYDVTNKDTNKRVNMEELALYSVKDGKIIKEEFFYH